MKIAILISGRGSNMLRIAELAEKHDGIADIVLIAANKPCEGLSLASERGLNTALVDRQAYGNRASQEAALAEAIDNSGADWVLLAGYMAISLARVRCEIFKPDPEHSPFAPSGTERAGYT